MIAYGTEEHHTAEMGSQIRQTCGSGMQLPFAASSFDMAICGLGTHHMDVLLLLAEIRRVSEGQGRSGARRHGRASPLAVPLGAGRDGRHSGVLPAFLAESAGAS